MDLLLLHRLGQLQCHDALILIQPNVKELKFESNKWRFTKTMKRDFRKNPAGRLWWVNTNTKVKTNVSNPCGDIATAPPGLRVFQLSFDDQETIVANLTKLFEEEERTPTVPYYNMAPFNNLHILFTSSDPEAVQMTVPKVMTFLYQRAPPVAELVDTLCKSVQKLLSITSEVLETESNLGIIKYNPGAGFQTHIDNVVRSGGSAGPVFTLSLGGDGEKFMDMFPVIEHAEWSPVRISTPIGSVIMMDGISRMEWSHGIPEGDPTERWTIMLKFRQISTNKVKFSKILHMPIFESQLHGI